MTMKKFIAAVLLLFAVLAADAQRFPKPDFESGYTYLPQEYAMPAGVLMEALDVAMLFAMLCVATWAVLRRRSRKWIIGISAVSLLYFGLYRKGCVCSVGSLQNVALALADSSYSIPWPALAIFFLPLAFALLFGRVFCSGVCPFGALQDLIHVKNYPLSRAVSRMLGVIPWLYLSLAVLFAVTRSSFLVCRFDPFVGFFRFGGETGLILFGTGLLVIAVFTGRPYCRFLCPYGALLKIFSRLSYSHAEITTQPCINCDLCVSSCPSDAILPPYTNEVKETRTQGVRRILTYALFLPLMIAVGAVAGNAVSDTLSRSNKAVKQAAIIKQHEVAPSGTESFEAQAFYSQGGVLDDLLAQAETVRGRFRIGSRIAGGFMGLVIGIVLLSLSLKRSRPRYTIDKGACVSCGRCFTYCPQNNQAISNVPDKTIQS
jgi:polyferredoxin